MTEDTIWKVKPPHHQIGAPLDGKAIVDGDAIRLEHVRTRKNLHSHDKPAPLTGGDGQNEVSAYADSPGIGNPQDNWFVSIGNGGGWYFDQEFRLRHFHAQGRILHSHAATNPDLTDGLYEVTTVVDGDSNDIFICELADQPEGTVSPSNRRQWLGNSRNSTRSGPSSGLSGARDWFRNLPVIILVSTFSVGFLLAWGIKDRLYEGPLQSQLNLAKDQVEDLKGKLAGRLAEAASSKTEPDTAEFRRAEVRKLFAQNPDRSFVLLAFAYEAECNIAVHQISPQIAQKCIVDAHGLHRDFDNPKTAEYNKFTTAADYFRNFDDNALLSELRDGKTPLAQEQMQMLQRYGISRLPMLLLYDRNGQLIDTTTRIDRIEEFLTSDIPVR